MSLNNSQNLIDSTKKWHGAGSHRPEVRSYQLDAVVSCVAEFKTKSRTQCLMAPGSGKTVVSLLIKEALKPKVTIFFVPSVQLIYQQYMSWAKFRTDDFDALVVTSTKLSEQNEAMLGLLKVNHVGVTTAASDIKTFIASKKYKNDRVIFCTYYSSGKVITACKNKEIDLIICDEAHHVSGRFDKRSVRLLDNERIKVKHRLFMTATPKLCRGEDDTLVSAGMNNPELFGDVAYTLSFNKAVELGILCDYRVYAAVVNKRELNNLKVKASHGEKISLAATKKIFEKDIGTRGLSFHNRIARSHKFAEHLREVLPKTTFIGSVDYTHSHASRNGMLDSLQNADRGIISNVSIFGEGFDYDELDFIIMVDPKNSITEIVQNIGRVIRKHKDKDIGTIVIPLYQQDGEISLDESLNKSSFEQIYRIATALGTVDMMLGDELRSGRRNPDVNNVQSLLFSNKIKIIKEDGIDDKQIDTLMKKITFSALYNTKRRTGLRDKSVEGAQAVLDWCNKHGRLPVNTGENGVEDALRCTYIQLLDPTAIMSPDVRTILELVQRTWGKDGKNVVKWASILPDILAWCEEHGHRPGRQLNGSWASMMLAIKEDNIPTQVAEYLMDDINKIMAFPSAAEVKDRELSENINNIVLWMREHNKTPTPTDVANGMITKRMYGTFTRRESNDKYDVLVEEAKKYPSHKNRVEEGVKIIAVWMREHNRAPTHRDAINGIIELKLYQMFMRREHSDVYKLLVEEAKKYPSNSNRRLKKTG